jgi:hypothetical protein
MAGVLVLNQPGIQLYDANGDPVYLSSPITDILSGRFFSFIYEGNSSSTESAFVLFRNPALSGKDFIIGRLLLDTVSKNQSCIMRIYAVPTITVVGTAITIGSRKLKGVPPTSSALLYSAPTATSFGTKAFVLSTGVGQQTLIDFVDQTVLVGPGFDLLMTAQSTANNALICVSASWAEITSS